MLRYTSPNSDNPPGISLSPLDIMGDGYNPLITSVDWTNFNGESNSVGSGIDEYSQSLIRNQDADIEPISQADSVRNHPATALLGSSNVQENPDVVTENVTSTVSKYGLNNFPGTIVAQPSLSDPFHHSLPSAISGASESSRGGRLSSDSAGARSKHQKPTANDHGSTHASRTLRGSTGLRYPILRNTVHLLRPIIPDSVSCDLLEAYFKVSPFTGAHLEPCVPPQVFKKSSFLGQSQLRRSSHALLVSMLWLSAQTTDIPFFNASIARRKHVRRQLLALTTKLLKPLNEVSFCGDIVPEDTRVQTGRPVTHESCRDSVNDGLGEIMAYAHLGMVTSAGEFRGASLRWWNLAFTLAREAKLQQELSDDLTDDDESFGSPRVVPEHSFSRTSVSHGHRSPHATDMFFWSLEDRKEERRRIWWFLYTVDRQICLSYNKPLSLLDGECQNLLRPDDDDRWQNVTPFTRSEASLAGRGPAHKCSSPTFFGFFTPLSAILGEIIYFVGARKHPRYGLNQSTQLDWKEWERCIEREIDNFEDSVQDMLANAQVEGSQARAQVDPLPIDHESLEYTTSTTASSSSDDNSMFQKSIVSAYARLVLHVLHVLLAGRWDPLALLDESDDWVSSPSFSNIIGHVVEMGKYCENLRSIDPSSHFMPFYLGIYLFQGSLPLLLVADRLKSAASDVIIQTCTRLVRTYESSIIRMPTDYQVSSQTFGCTAHITRSNFANYLDPD